MAVDDLMQVGELFNGIGEGLLVDLGVSSLNTIGD